MDDVMHVPELEDARFYTEVMQLDADKTEAQHDRELLAKAHELGIMATLPTVSKAHQLASSTMSDSTNSIPREQAVSTASDGSTGAYSTPRSSIYGVPSPDLLSSCDNGNNDGLQPQSLDFSPYEEYLAKAGLALPAPSAPRSSMASLERSDRSIFNVRTKNSLSDVKTRFRDRFRRKKKPTGGPEPPLAGDKEGGKHAAKLLCKAGAI
ncbi:hypothetical protein E4U19_001113 [Claviceps sp. Clav32 group G5]|nr:hypothetical protein E4U40_006551 [Claviceps sp. LM458 group G5]KAG6029201.1 hypothetical protein E4U19_001113 [Claviceps sp. Clav32 group G5]KAG6048044.1 hypothetical protein E4U39_007813 [Claviceps sp. Clav50 group G5]